MRASQALRPVQKHWAVQKPWETAVPAGQANRQQGESVRASASLDDPSSAAGGAAAAEGGCPASPAAFLLSAQSPGGSPARFLFYGSVSTLPGIRSEHRLLYPGKLDRFRKRGVQGGRQIDRKETRIRHIMENLALAPAPRRKHVLTGMSQNWGYTLS